MKPFRAKSPDKYSHMKAVQELIRRERTSQKRIEKRIREYYKKEAKYDNGDGAF